MITDSIWDVMQFDQQAPLKRFELLTIGLEVRCSVLLSYRGKNCPKRKIAIAQILPLIIRFQFSLPIFGELV